MAKSICSLHFCSSPTSTEQPPILLLLALVAMSNGVPFQPGMFSFADCEPGHRDAPHFLESCFLCRKRLSRSSDIFMYRGSTPFCSMECREEQIEMDESKERNWRKMYANGRARSSLRSGETNLAVNKVQVHVA